MEHPNIIVNRKLLVLDKTEAVLKINNSTNQKHVPYQTLIE